MRWAGIDVGGIRKGFHVALIEGSDDSLRLVEPLLHIHGAEAVARVASLLAESAPRVIAVDSPVSLATPGSLSREGERSLKRAVCGIRYTPDEETIRSHPGTYYEWILHGLELYAALERELGSESEVIECFPTASWTRLGGGRAGEHRSIWTGRVLREELVLRWGLESVPERLSQDGRDAVVAAVTAYLHHRGKTESFGELVVPAIMGDEEPSRIREIGSDEIVEVLVRIEAELVELRKRLQRTEAQREVPDHRTQNQGSR